MSQLRYLFLFFLLLLSQPGSSHESSLRIVTEQWPPMSFEKDGTAQGMAVELTRLIQKNLAMHGEIEVLPWPRAYNTALTQSNVLLFAMIRTPEREKNFTLIGPIAYGEIALYMPANGRALKNVPDLANIKKSLTVATYRGTAFQSLLKQQGFKKVVPVNSPENAVRMLMSGRVDVLCDDDLAIAELFRRAGYLPQDSIKVASLKSSSLYYAFSRETEPLVISNWQSALAEIKHTGDFERLYKKWFPHLTAPKELHRLTPPSRGSFRLLEMPVKRPQVAELLIFRPPDLK
ncbi:substrate-binding periplasmic protein [Bdellovibrio bacteriovorus]|uniref:substrate-binding periplasmic protein n=1 Tax=Bdellovibrio bacteriovorus TaxID=959 RepID=UPI0035A5721E